jgi:hypothetical protein
MPIGEAHHDDPAQGSLEMLTRISRWTLLTTLALAIMAPRYAVAQAQSEAPEEVYPGRYVANCKPAGNGGCVCDTDEPRCFRRVRILGGRRWSLSLFSSEQRARRRIQPSSGGYARRVRRGDGRERTAGNHSEAAREAQATSMSHSAAPPETSEAAGTCLPTSRRSSARSTSCSERLIADSSPAVASIRLEPSA